MLAARFAQRRMVALCALLGSWVIAPTAPAQTGSAPVMDEAKRVLVQAIPINGVPQKISLALPTDEDDASLSGNCSCDASSPSGATPPELADARTDHDTGDPVALHNGMVSLNRVDLCVPGRGVSFGFTRAYSSKIEPRSNDVYPLGQGWDHNYNLQLVVHRRAGGIDDYDLFNGNTRIDKYVRAIGTTAGTYRWYSYGVYSEMKVESTGVVIRARHGTKTYFTLPDVNYPGRVTKIEDRNGNALTFEYDANPTSDASAKLVTISDALGREVSLSYYSGYSGSEAQKNRLLHTVTDFSGRTVTFDYVQMSPGSSGDVYSWVLSTATSPSAATVTDSTFSYGWTSGKTEGYLYRPYSTHPNLRYNLEKVIAPRDFTGISSGLPSGSAYVKFVYDESDPSTSWTSDWCIEQWLGDTGSSPMSVGGVIQYQYDTTDSLVYTGSASLGHPEEIRMKTSVVDREGRETDYFFNERGNVLQISEHTSEFTAGVVNTVFEYHWSTSGQWGADAEIKAVYLPEGSKEERFYITPASSPAARFTMGNLERIKWTGFTGTPAPERNVYFSWEPVYNHPLTKTDELGNVTTFLSDYMEGNDTPSDPDYVLDDVAAELWITTTDAATIVGSLLLDTDLNGDGKLGVCRGNIVQKIYPEVDLGSQATWSASPQQAWETDSTQQGVYSLTYNGYGQVTSQTNPEENVTVFLYTSETDLNDDGTADGIGGSDTLTGGYLKSVVIDTVLPYPNASSPHPQLTGVGPRSLATDIGRNSGTNPTPKHSTVDLKHDTLGNVIERVDPRGVKSTYAVNELREIWKVVESASVSTSGRAAAFNGADEASADLPAISNIEQRWKYDANGCVIEWQRKNAGNEADTGAYSGWLEAEYSYDILNRLVSEVSEFGTAGQMATRQYVFEPGDDQVDQIQEPEGNLTSFTYNDRGLLESVTEGDSSLGEDSTVTFEYDKNRNRTQITDGANHTTTFAFDDFDQLKTVTDPLGTQTRYFYDDASRLTKVEVFGLPDGSSTTALTLTRTEYRYDERSRLYQVDHSDPQTALVDGALTASDGKVSTRMDLDRVGRRIGLTKDDASTFRTSFDGMDNPILSSDPKASSADSNWNSIQREFDDNGNLIKLVQTDKYPGTSTTRSFETFHRYDALNRLIVTTNNAGDTQRFEYDSRSNLVASSDAQNPNNESTTINGRTVNQPGNTRRYYHNGYDQVIREELDLRVGGDGTGSVDTSNPYNANGIVKILTTYDKNGRVTIQADDKRNDTTYRYNSRGLVKKQTFGDNTFQLYQYDLANNLSQVTDARGNVVDMSYDAANRLSEVNVTKASGTVGTELLVFEYDGLARRTKSISSEDGTIGGGSSSDDWTVTRSFDALSRVTTENQNGRTVSNDWSEEGKRTTLSYASSYYVDYTYDGLGRLVDVKPGGSALATYRYAGWRLHDRVYANGVSELHHSSGSDTAFYDAAGRATRVEYRNSSSTLLSGFEHEYDRMSNRRYERRLHHSDKGDNYEYDSLYRVTGFERGVNAGDVGSLGGTSWQAKKQYVLDGVHNWRELFINGSSTAQTAAVDDTNAYTSFGAKTPDYDAEGNLTSPDSSASSPVVMEYDFLNRLRTITQGSSVVTHDYDAEGRRVRTTTTSVSGAPAHIEYVYDGWQVIEERNGSGSLMRRFVMGLGVDEPLQLENISFWPNAGTYHYQRSTLGNVVALTNSSGAVVERYSFDAYGSPQFENASNVDQSLSESAYGNPYLFQGRRYEPWLYAMYEYRTRMYSPEMGRFVQRDSIGVWGDPGQFGNPFSFVGSSPFNRLDPYGEDMLNDIWLGTLEVAGSVTSFTVGVYDAFSGGLYSKTVEAAGAGESWGESLAMFPVSNRVGHAVGTSAALVSGGAAIYRGGATLLGSVTTTTLGFGGGGAAAATTHITISTAAAVEGAKYAGGGLILLAAGSESASNGPRGGKGEGKPSRPTEGGGRYNYPRPKPPKEVTQRPRNLDGTEVDDITKEVSSGPMDWGHAPGWEFWRWRQKAIEQCWTREEWITFWYDPGKWIRQTRYNNRSHKYEMP